MQAQEGGHPKDAGAGSGAPFTGQNGNLVVWVSGRLGNQVTRP